MPETTIKSEFNGAAEAFLRVLGAERGASAGYEQRQRKANECGWAAADGRHAKLLICQKANDIRQQPCLVSGKHANRLSICVVPCQIPS